MSITIEERLARLEALITEIKSDIQEVKADLKTKNTYYCERTKDMYKKISELENKMNTSEIETEKRIGNIKTKLFTNQIFYIIITILLMIIGFLSGRIL